MIRGLRATIEALNGDERLLKATKNELPALLKAVGVAAMDK